MATKRYGYVYVIKYMYTCIYIYRIAYILTVDTTSLIKYVQVFVFFFFLGGIVLRVIIDSTVEKNIQSSSKRRLMGLSEIYHTFSIHS